MRNTVFDQDDFDAVSYSQYRIQYPNELFKIIYAFHTSTTDAEFHLALDVATGTGQTSSQLSLDFTRVIGMDLSETMLKSAIVKPNIQYIVGSAEELPSSIAPGSVDLVTVTEAAHWFHMEPFYNECHRVLKTSGTLAILGYGVCTVVDPDLTEMIRAYAMDFLDPYWDVRKKRLDRYYCDPDYVDERFHLDRRFYDADTSCLRKTLDLHSFGLFLKTWSAYKIVREKCANDVDPVDALISRMLSHLNLNGRDSRTVSLEFTWPFVLLLMKKKF